MYLGLTYLVGGHVSPNFDFKPLFVYNGNKERLSFKYLVKVLSCVVADHS